MAHEQRGEQADREAAHEVDGERGPWKLHGAPVQHGQAGAVAEERAEGAAEGDEQGVGHDRRCSASTMRATTPGMSTVARQPSTLAAFDALARLKRRSVGRSNAALASVCASHASPTAANAAATNARSG